MINFYENLIIYRIYIFLDHSFMYVFIMLKILFVFPFLQPVFIATQSAAW